MENKVWVLMHEWAYDGESNFDIEVFQNRDDAIKDRDKLVNSYKEDDALFNNNSITTVVDADDDTNFTAYEEDNYCGNHVEIHIVSREVR